VAPLGIRKWLREHGVAHAWELDWWDELRVNGAAVMSLPARHFSARGLRDRMATLWCGWAIEAEGWRVLFCGDSGDHPEWGEIGRRAGPFDLMMIPVGAYDPRWFMKPVHMNPEEAVSAYERIRAGSEGVAESEGRGGPPTGKVSTPRHDPVMLPIHWGTFKLTDEPLDEPPARTRAAWGAAGLNLDNLWLLHHGETRELTHD
jgi:N-acyl-phosphatidylethanolamine-hydrolysing phospholipase D